MANSWNIIGWLIIGLAAGFISRTIIVGIYRFIRDWLRYRRTKAITPEEGQVWRGRNNAKYYVLFYNKNKNGICLTTLNPNWTIGTRVSWTDTLIIWHARVKNEWLYLADSWMQD